jgi:uncharacterized protein with PQ loop repeat
MPFIIATLIITFFCFAGLIRTAKEKNLFGIGFSLIATAVFGFFSIASIIEKIVKMLAA